MEEFSRTELLIGKDGLEILRNSSVAVFGIGGVGSYTVEALARCGIGKLLLVDNDTVSKSNINRQIIALHSTIGKPKTEVMKERIMDINPACIVETKNVFYLTEDDVDISGVDYVVDAIDTVSAKLALISNAKALDIPIISSMGTGNKLDSSKFRICDIKKTTVCPLARVMRRELKARGITNLKVLFSDENPHTNSSHPSDGKKPIPASISFVPSVAGLMIAGEVIKDLLHLNDNTKNEL
ncbi:MAG: tRNA threonylcarbamoyladenosine dehydratase [Eubacteriales bacterium]|nr:tRNA threonylcarbamoyladenosine dehydratase [Eubacteriales bacterium]